MLIPVSPAGGSDVPIGTSRLGGTPDLPDGWNWPAAEPTEDCDQPLFLPFLAQFNLADLPLAIHTLPRSGRIYIFAAQEDADENANVVLFDDGPVDRLKRHPDPCEGMYADEDFDEAFGVLAIREFLPAVSLPDHCGWADDEDAFINDGHADQYSELRQALLAYEGQKEPVSRVGGYLYSPYGGEPDDDQWQLLVQIESYFGDGIEMNFWDAGCQQVFAKSLAPVDGRIPETQATVFSM